MARLDPASAVVANTLASRGAGDAKRIQTDRLQRILDDLPAHLQDTGRVAGNRIEDLHPAFEVIPEESAVFGLRGMTCVIGGASRGIGQGIAVRFAKSGANVCVLGRSDGMVETGPGTLSAVVKQINQVGGKGLAVQCDLRLAVQVDSAVATVVKTFGSIDIVVRPLCFQGTHTVHTQGYLTPPLTRPYDWGVHSAPRMAVGEQRERAVPVRCRGRRRVAI